MRRLTAALAALGIAIGLTLVAVDAAEATITSPTNGSTVGGTITLADTGATDTSSLCITGSSAQTRIRVFNAANATVFDQTKSGAGAASFNWDTHTVPNGAYKVQADERNKASAVFCSNPTTTVSVNITVTNTVDLGYTGALSAPQNTTLPMSISVTDPNNAGAPVAGIPVTVSLTGQAGTATGTSNASGVVSVNLPVSGPPRTGATLTLAFAGTANWAAKTVTRSFDVNKNGSATTLAQPAAVVHGQATSFTATVTATNGVGTPGGSVQFTLDGNNYGSPVALSGGSASTAPDAGLSTASHTIGAIYSGSTDFNGSTAATKTQVVSKAATTTTLSDSPSGSTVSGQAVTFTAHVDVVSPGVGTLAGGVQFNVDGAPFGTAVPLGAGDNASLTISNLSVANHDVVAVYNGNADFALSSSATLTHGVGKASTTLDLTSSVNPAYSGAPITYTAVVAPVAPGAGTPTGNVQFAVDGVDLGAPVPLSGGQAVSPVSNQQVEGSPHVVTANYEGDANFSGQTDSLDQTIIAALTTTDLTAGPNPSVFGQPVTVHAQVNPVAPATGHPTGTIRFYVDGAVYDFVDMTNGGADLTISNLAVGPHTFKAVYLSDDLNFFTSTSPVIDQTVNKAATKTVVATSTSPSVFGQPVTFTASVSVLAPGAGNPSGTIVFKDGSTTIGTETVSSATGEQASITVSGLGVGSHAITATYSGDDSFNGSAGNVPQTVTRAQTSLVLASSANPAQSGQGVQFTATVSPVAPGAGTPTGTVRFFVNGANLGGAVALAPDGTATSSVFASLSPGTYSITATYSGDGNFVGSQGVLDQGTGQNISKGATTVAVTSGPSPSAYGDPVTVTTTVKGVAPAVGKPTGVVQIWEGDELLGATSLAPQADANTSQATFVTSSLAAGTHALTAVYVGNFNFAGGSAGTTQTVGAVPTVTGIASESNPAVYGDTVSFTATVNTSAGTPTGSVTFKEGTAVLGSAPVGDGGQATLAVAGLHAGAHTVTATYSGDVSHSASTSAGFGQVITKAPTTIVAADVNNPGPLAPRTNWIRAKLVDRYGNPMAGRSISFDAPPGQSRPARHLCDAVTNAQGIAECDTQVISIDIALDLGNQPLLDVNGTYDVTYSGDADTIGDTARGHEY